MTRGKKANQGGPIDYRQMSDSRVEQLRIPPQSIQSEQAVLGGLMLAPDAWPKIADKLTETDFYRRDHQLIYRAIAEMAEADPPKPYDAVTLGEWFESQGMSELVAGGAYLIELASTTPSAANITAYAAIVRDKAMLRELIDAGTQVVNDAFQPEGRESSELVAAASLHFSQIADGNRDTGGLVMCGGHLSRTLDELEARQNGSGSQLIELPFGDPVGFDATDLIVVAGRPGMGKTIFGLECAMATCHAGKYAAVFSVEMGASQVMQRLISRRTAERAAALEDFDDDSLARVPYNKMRHRGALTDADWNAVAEAVSYLKSIKIAIDDTAPMTHQRLRARAMRLQSKLHGDLGMVVVDYLQLLHAQDPRQGRYELVTEISQSLKSLAKELRCPVVALSQLSRKVEDRADKRPQASDLRESGAIEQDADTIMFLYRDDFYNPATLAPGVTEIIVNKFRHGPCGTGYLKHDLACSRFTTYHGKPQYATAKQSSEPRKRRGYGADTASARAGDDR